MEQLSPQVMHRLVFTVLMQHLPDAQSGPALQVLTDALANPNQQVRELAVVALAELPTSPARRVAALALGMKDEAGRVRRRAARAIADQGPAAHAALNVLVAGLKDTDASVRRDCAGAVGRLGPVAHAAAGLLVPMLGDAETRTRAVVAVALKRIGRAAVPALRRGMEAADLEFRGRCEALIHQIAPDVPAAEPSVTDTTLMAVKTPPPTPMPIPRRLTVRV